MIIAIAMNVSDHTSLKKSYLLHVSFRVIHGSLRVINCLRVIHGSESCYQAF